MKKNKMIILTGPTAVGKTRISIELAKRIGGEIISADSMQVYRGMDIGTAKIRKEEMQGIPHHLIDCLNPDEEFNVVVFQQMAGKAAQEIYDRGHIPIIAGGTAFYIQALLYGVDFTKEEHDMAYREELYQQGETAKGKSKLYEMLCHIDPVYAEIVHENNVKRVVRALEYHHFTGERFSAYNERQMQKCAEYDFHYFVLNDLRERLYANINLRVDLMVEEGLILEAKNLYQKGYDRSCPSMQGIGYKELFDCFDGFCTQEEAIDRIKQNTRHFAKRQLTWFKREKDVIWIEKDVYQYDDSKILDSIIDTIEKDGESSL